MWHQICQVSRQFFPATLRSTSASILYLPEEILEEILVRVPAKTLGQAQLVSKQWQRIISNRSFVQRHARRWSTTPQFLIRNVLNPLKQGFMSYVPLDAPTSSRRSSGHGAHKLTVVRQDMEVTLLATCSGLAVFFGVRSTRLHGALCTEYVLLVGNPTTKSYVELPAHNSIFMGLYGLAFDVAISATSFKLVVLNVTTFSIITSADHKWREVVHSLHSAADPVRAHGNSVYSAGKLHWLAGPGSRVVVFDTTTDTGSLMDHPAVSESSIGQPCLGSANGHLCLLAAFKDGCVRIWSLVEYSGKGVWTLERQIAAPCNLVKMELLLYDGDKCMSLVQEEGCTTEFGERSCKMLVHRVNGSSSTSALWEEPWPLERLWKSGYEYLPFCSTMLNIQK